MALLVAALALFASACASAERPTVTNELLPPVATEPGPATNAVPTTDPAPTEPDSGSDSEQAGQVEPVDQTPLPVEFLGIEILEQFPHDPTAFTQGLELRDGDFIESTGNYGESTLRRVDIETGEVLQRVDIDEQFFAEGLTQVGDELVQLTWQENVAFFWDAETFTRTRDVAYQGEGWGICFDGDRLVMTDGTPVLIFRDPGSFEEIGRVPVTFNGLPLSNLNEVECVAGEVWANIWLSNEIVRIDPATGQVTGLVDAGSLDSQTDDGGAVLNGIAWDEQSQSFFVTGKYWPTMYRVNFVATG